MSVEDIEVDEQETTRLVRHVATCLEEAGGSDGMNLFEFIVNPHDFGQTIENLFYLSFLVKENRACIETGDNHEPIVCKCRSPSHAAKTSSYTTDSRLRAHGR